MIYTCLTWELAADSHVLEFQRLRNKVLSTTGNVARRAQLFDTHVAFKIPHLLDFVTNFAGNRQK
jgi:hypothetical protein